MVPCSLFFLFFLFSALQHRSSRRSPLCHFGFLHFDCGSSHPVSVARGLSSSLCFWAAGHERSPKRFFRHLYRKTKATALKAGGAAAKVVRGKPPFSFAAGPNTEERETVREAPIGESWYLKLFNNPAVSLKHPGGFKVPEVSPHPHLPTSAKRQAGRSLAENVKPVKTQ